MGNSNSRTGQTTQDQGVISVLQDLSARAHDSELGYRRAAEDVQDADLKRQFEQLANERASMASELDRLVREHGGEPSWTEGTTLGAVHRMFTDLKSAITGGSRQSVLTEIARGESAAEEAYDQAMRQSLPMNARRVVQEQHRRVRETRNRYRAMSGMGESTRRTGALAQQWTSGQGGAVSQYMYERPVMASVVVFAIGFVLGALTVSSMESGQGQGQGRQRQSW